MRKLLIAVLALVAIIAGLALVLRTPDTDPAAMTAKYANAASRFAESADGMRVHYRDQGRADGVPLILIHGTASSLHTWEPLVQRLGGEYRIITLTLPGHGLTGPHPRDDYSYAGLAEAVDLVADDLSLDHFVLGGNSLGGWMTWRYALAHPERVDALLLLNAWGMPLREGEPEPKSNIGFRILQWPLGRALSEHFTPRGLIKASALQSVSRKEVMTDEIVDRYWELLRLPGNRRAAGLRIAADREIHFADRISEISAPVLVIWGDEDQLIPVSAATTFRERLPQAEVAIYPGVGHLPMEEVPDQTAADISGFLSRHIAPPTD